MSKSVEFDDYSQWLITLKQRIQTSQQKAVLAVNHELILLYWQIGKEILQRQQQQGWGAKIIEQLSHDLSQSFPEMKGFSARNLKYMRKFAESYPQFEIVQQAVAQIPWGHNVALLDRLSTLEERLFYANKAQQHGWSRAVLVHQIENRLIEREGSALNNFADNLPAPMSELAQQTLKDPYIFDFLSLTAERKERDLEQALTQHISQFLLELGTGFAFVGKQVHLEVGGDDFYLDLLFYHLKMRCYFVIELKTSEFKPEHLGQLNFYLNAIDAQMKSEQDTPTIGLLLCKTRNRLVAEYALRGNNKPIGIAEYQLLPNELQQQLPNLAELEKQLAMTYKEYQ